MSKSLINTYLSDIDRLRTYGGTSTEEVVREAFKDLLKSWAKSQNLVFIPELAYQTNLKTRVKTDGTILHDLRVPLGYWEAKDTSDDLDEEIRKKLTKGYPQDNIIFENSDTAVLIQNRAEVVRCSMTDTDALSRLVSRFFGYERPEIAQFRRAVDQFRTDLPAVLEALREKIDAAYASNPSFRVVADAFLAHARDTINPTLTEADVREMLIQHILTEEIFTQVFDSGQFHQENNIAQELFKLERAFFTGAVKADALKVMKPYYAAIRANAAQITSHAEKQTFLKVIYENFYKVYNPKAADRLGVVYTPNDIVRFMIEGADWLCHKHFGKNLIDRGVEILDPATGTGTFICELIESFRGQPQKLHHKYKEELHANEVAILPYYVANLNIEATYAAVAGQYAEFENLCFVDTLDNVAALGETTGHIGDLFAALSDENVERVKRQNKRKISVIIGNPPYNANQQNENDNNKNRVYPRIDDLIKRSFVKLSTAQKTKVYDMYARFFRWSFDRVHDDGIIAFVTNRSFIDSRTFDGFRRYVQETFAEVYVVDLKGDARTSGEQRRKERGNVFDDQIRVGIAIAFFVKKRGAKGLKVFYDVVPDYTTSEDKRAWLAATKLADRPMTQVHPDKSANWINLSENDWDAFLPVADKKTKLAKTKGQERAIFKLYSLGVVTARDEWVIGLTADEVTAKVEQFLSSYAEGLVTRDRLPWELDAASNPNGSIKWTRALKASWQARRPILFNNAELVPVLYRPFWKETLYFSTHLNEMQYQLNRIFPGGQEAKSITISGQPASKPFQCLALQNLPSYDTLEKTTCLPLERSGHGGTVDNITDWALNRFVAHYGKAAKITKDAIFHYVYGVLHDPVYRETYAQNLKRDLPRIPLYPDFAQWADWGRRLMDLHIGYDSVTPWPLTRTDTEDRKARAAGQTPAVKLKVDKEAGTITLDTETVLSGIPPVAWTYRLGNRSGLEWVLDQAREKTPKDPTIRARFNTYRFADHKERVIDLLTRVTRVSVETMEIVEAMRAGHR